MEKDTFSEVLKEELAHVRIGTHAQAFWEAYALRRYLPPRSKRESKRLKDGTVVSGRPFLLRRLYFLEKKLSGQGPAFRRQGKGLLIDGNGLPAEPPLHILLKNAAARRCYLRGTFLARGSVASPHKSHHLEMAFANRCDAMWIKTLLEKEELKAGITDRRSAWVVYLKDSDEISKFLTILGAFRSVLEYENIRAKKNLKSSVQRLVNMDRANVSRAVEAALRQIEDIVLIDSERGLSSLSPALRELAVLRLENPDMTMEELGQALNPPASKSAVNHRFRRIAEIASRLRAEMSHGDTGKNQLP
ncbi:MAG TPA: DNA-binding protein WhiA [Firmicutes bacterium]|nr:DNA-binding protein WhiA [Candidatus Fermentithermobacillaceae bacterium]